MATIDGTASAQEVLPDRDPALAGELARPADQLDPALLEPGKLTRVVEIVDHLVAPAQRGIDVELPRDHLADTRDPLDLGAQLAGAQQRLRGHARVVRALAADQVLLDQRHLEAAFRQPPGADLARRARPRSRSRRIPARHSSSNLADPATITDGGQEGEDEDPGAARGVPGEARSRPKTPEPPASRATDGGDGNSFVVHEHHARRLHWDLRLEHNGVLLSFALPRGVPQDPSENRLAVHTEDHPIEYLDFHGTIPKGEYGAGEMTIWDRGTYEPEKIEENKIVARFDGERVKGRYALFQTRGDDWMIHRMDPPDPGREPLPEHIEPMKATLAKLPSRRRGLGV